ncbi:hypothetical protein pb186bvf_001731 [Paramecium bursaria]
MIFAGLEVRGSLSSLFILYYYNSQQIYLNVYLIKGLKPLIEYEFNESLIITFLNPIAQYISTFILMDISTLLENIQKLKQNVSKTMYNMQIIGPTGAGKSAISNTTMADNDLRFLKQKGSGGCYLPKTVGTFQISEDQTKSMTLIPQGVQINDQFTIWDLPGFGDNRSVEIDVQTTLLTSFLLANCQKSLIMLLIPHKQLIQDKAQKLVEIINMITDQNANIILVISKAEQQLTSKYIKEFIIKWICNDQQNEKQTRLTDCSKQLLQKIIDNEQILIFRQPLPSLVEGEYQFCQENLNDIKKVLFDKKFYTQLKFELNFSPRAQEYIDNIQQQLLVEISSQEQNLLRTSIQININQFKFQTDIQNQLQQQHKHQYDDDYEEYQTLVNNFNDFQAIIKSKSKPYNSSILDNNIKNIEIQIQNIYDNTTDSELYISGLKYSSTQLMNKMNEFQQKKIKIKSVHILAIISFSVDGDITLPGVNIHITTQALIVLKKSIINLKGQKGEPFQKAKIMNNQLPHSNMGRQGQNGGSLQLLANQYHNSDLLTVNISGGDGGDGQDGADGKDGQNGNDGRQKKVMKMKQKYYVKYDELPISWAQNLLTFNRTFNCEFSCDGEKGTEGGDAREGGQGGCTGIQGTIQIYQPHNINIIDNQSYKGEKGVDGQVGRGGKYGRKFVGVHQVIKMFGRINEPENLQSKQDTIGEGIVGNSITSVGGTTAGAMGYGYMAQQALAKTAQVATQIGKQVITQAASNGSKIGVQMIEGCVAGVTLGTVAVAAGATLLAQGALSITQILWQSNGNWISQHYEENQNFAQSGKLLQSQDNILDEQICEQAFYDLGIQKQKQFQNQMLNKIKEQYKNIDLANRLVKEFQKIPN